MDRTQPAADHVESAACMPAEKPAIRIGHIQPIVPGGHLAGFVVQQRQCAGDHSVLAIATEPHFRAMIAVGNARVAHETIEEPQRLIERVRVDFDATFFGQNQCGENLMPAGFINPPQTYPPPVPSPQ